MKVKTSVGERTFDVINIIICVLLSLSILIPILNILFASLSDPLEVMKRQGLFLWPVKFTTQAYHAVAKNPNIISGYSNTIFIVVVGTTLNIFLTLIGAYVLSRKDVMFGKFLTDRKSVV